MIGVAFGCDSMIELPIKVKKGDKVSSSEWNKMVDILSLVRLIQIGKVIDIDTSSVGLKQGIVNFPKPFQTLPIVVLTLENIDERVIPKAAWVSEVSTLSFKWNLSVTAPRPGTKCNLNWVAIE